MARKKRSAQGRSPLKGARRDEVVEDVVDELRPWKNHNSRDTVRVAVNQQLDLLIEFIPLHREVGDIGPIRKHAKKLNEALSNLEKLLASSPGLLTHFLFDPRPMLNADYNGDFFERSKRVQARSDALVAELKRLRDMCDRKYPVHPNYDDAKNASALFSYGLMRRHSDGTIRGTENQAYRIITSRMYEVVSGQKDADLKRACDEVLHYKRYYMSDY